MSWSKDKKGTPAEVKAYFVGLTDESAPYFGEDPEQKAAKKAHEDLFNRARSAVIVEIDMAAAQGVKYMTASSFGHGSANGASNYGVRITPETPPEKNLIGDLSPLG